MMQWQAYVIKCTSLAAAACSIFPTYLYAGAWNQPESKAEVITSGSYYSSDKFNDRNGNSTAQPDYSKYSVGTYAEYGLTDWLTIGSVARTEYIAQQLASNDSSYNYGLSDVEIFGRIPVWQGDNAVISVQSLVKLPMVWRFYSTPAIGRSGFDAEAKLAAGYSFSLFGYHDYIESSFAYRARDGNVGDQLRYELSLAVNPWERLGFLAQFFHTAPANGFSTSLGVISESQDYSLTTAQLSAIYAISDSYSLQLGGFGDIEAKNTGEGQGLMLGWWSRF